MSYSPQAFSRFRATGSPVYTPTHGFSGNDSFAFMVSGGVATSTAATVSINVNPPSDSDADGMPDSWELLHFLDNTGVNPNLDRDGNGVGNP